MELETARLDYAAHTGGFEHVGADVEQHERVGLAHDHRERRRAVARQVIRCERERLERGQRDELQAHRADARVCAAFTADERQFGRSKMHVHGCAVEAGMHTAPWDGTCP